jgi:hypothetical protein
MPQEPWKRARQLHELRQAGIKSAANAGQPRPVIIRRPRWSAVVGWTLLVLLLGGAATAYFTRGWWFPRYRAELPPKVEQVVEQVAPEPAVTLDYQALESGLGIGLRIFGDYLDVLNATNDWGVTWQLTDTGNGTQRCGAPGLLLYVEGGRIRSYELDLPTVFATPAWQPWYQDLKRAGITPDLTWTALTGESEMPGGVAEREIHSSTDSEWAGGPAHAVWKLAFSDGWLRYLNGGITIGSVSLEEAAAGASPEQGGTPPDPAAQPSAPAAGRDWVQ